MIEVVPNWHPAFVHFTVALLITAVAMFVIGVTFSSKSWHRQLLQAAKWNYWLGTVAAVATAIAGWFAYNSVAHDTPSHAAMTVHRNWALVTLSIILLLAAYLYWSSRRKGSNSGFLLGGMLSVAVLTGTTAWHGGELVYRYGLGVMSMPMAEGEDHDHGGADHHSGAGTAAHHDAETMPHHSEATAGDHHEAPAVVEKSAEKVQAIPEGHEH